MSDVFTTWSILYVGIVTVSVTAPAYKMLNIGQVAFWFGFIGYFSLLPIICYRVFKLKNIPEPLTPMLIVFSAPISLLLAGYMSSFTEKNIFIIYLLVIISMGFYLYSMIMMTKLLKLKFYPTISAFTFPLVISATALKLFTAFIGKQGGNTSILLIVVKIEEIIALVIVLYVLVRYLKFILKK
ncbi:MAG: hypothetical protein KBA67_06790 [Leptotrichiaceae bacterium]|nr:hypothetical protein [Leptotrichiaceae bacterium]MBP6280716.1 hypothetical protein [Leptotrichiaceae bacterium]MBP7101221.1 hypothetical protein [Leptotrichiaceae bacterium]MBP7739391.1 hypothetical protein [Leptotrichiaceae bacterium]MBP9629235.1 hypothetical protein [Leptotrichiaceae bacterium]